MTEAQPHEGALRYDDVRDKPIQLTPEELEVFHRKAAVLKELLTDSKVVAKYKLEVVFGKARSMSKPTPGILSFWASGTKFHGGGDEKIYLCPGAQLRKNGCRAPILDAYNSAGGAVCPTCGTVWKPTDLIGEILLNLTMRNWAEVLYTHYRLFDYDCDIYLKHAPADMRSIARAQSEKATWRGSQMLERTRGVRARHVYPLRNIIKDTAAGADLLGRFYAFLTS